MFGNFVFFFSFFFHFISDLIFWLRVPIDPPRQTR
jgi:hypothetical protein